MEKIFETLLLLKKSVPYVGREMLSNTKNMSEATGGDVAVATIQTVTIIHRAHRSLCAVLCKNTPGYL
jgi:hypothetical protein